MTKRTLLAFCLLAFDYGDDGASLDVNDHEDADGDGDASLDVYDHEDADGDGDGDFDLNEPEHG